MKSSNAILRALAVFVAVSILQILAAVLAALIFPPTAAQPHMPQHFAQWLFLSNLVTITALSVFAFRTEWRGFTLGAAVAAIPLVIVLINGIEGSIFLKNSHIDWPQVFLSAAIGAVLSVPVWALLFGRRADHPQPHFHPIASKSIGERAWKFLLCDVSYIALYLIAGSIIWPYIKDFYATQTVPPMRAIFALQLLVRGPVFIVLCILMVRMLALPRISGALAVGILFTLLSGIAPLLMPNPYFPDSVRWMHFCEVTSSNFLFGTIVGLLWGPPKSLSAPLSLQPA